MSSNAALQRLTKKKGDKLSKFLGIDSDPSTRLIANMQSRINNPLFKLSMADYEVMCGNKMMVKMMSKVLGCKEKQLKKFCKYINVFSENIKSSPKSIKKKMIAIKNINASKKKGSLNLLPDDVYYLIVEQYKTIFKINYVLKDWVPNDNLHWDFLSMNPNTIELLKANLENIDWDFLSMNPNPEAIELLKANSNKINWEYLSQNPNAIELLKANPDKIDWYYLSKNPNAIDMLKENPDEIYWVSLSMNQNKEAIELLEANPTKIEWQLLSINSNAIELLKRNPEKIDWEYFSLNQDPYAIALLKANPDKIDWEFLSENPAAIKLLQDNPQKIVWRALSGNPAIFDEILV